MTTCSTSPAAGALAVVVEDSAGVGAARAHAWREAVGVAAIDPSAAFSGHLD